MEQAEIQDEIFAYLEADHAELDKNTVKTALREMINVGKIMYAYGGGASSVEIPSQEYLKEKGLI
jgi:hypothetical protein